MGYFTAPKRQDHLLSPGASHNVVDLMKIYLGQDVRTTVSSLTYHQGYDTNFAADHVAQHPQSR